MFRYFEIKSVPHLTIDEYLAQNHLVVVDSNPRQIDLDGGGRLEEIQFSENRHSLSLRLSDQTFQEMNLPENLTNEYLADFQSEYFKDPVTRYVACDVNRDGKLDLIFQSGRKNPSLRIFLNQIPAGSLDKLESEFLEKYDQAYRPVPEYERSGVLHFGNSLWGGREMLSEPVSREVFLGQYPDLSKLSLPTEFVVGHIGLGKFPWSSHDVTKEMAGEGVDVKEDYGDWIQDSSEYLLAMDATVSNLIQDRFWRDWMHADSHVRVGASGGDLGFVRNKEGRMLMLLKNLSPVVGYQRDLMWTEAILQSFDDAKAGLANYLGVDDFLAIGHYGSYVHSDQAVFFPMDGKAIIAASQAIPSRETKQLKENVENAGFDVVATIDIPKTFVNESRSPLNIIVLKNSQTGRPQYFIPLDPIMVIDTHSGDALDLRKGYSRERWMKFYGVESGSFRDMPAGKDDYLFIYDTKHPWSFVGDIQQALMSIGIPREDILFVPYNGVGRGSLHCTSNLEPSPDDLR